MSNRAAQHQNLRSERQNGQTNRRACCGNPSRLILQPSRTLTHQLLPTEPSIRPPAALAKMLSRSSFGRQAQRALQRQCRAQPANRRGLAAPASGSFNYDTGDASGIKYASRDMSGPTTTLALVSKAGTRYQYLPGLTEGLEKYAYRVCNQESRSLRYYRASPVSPNAKMQF